MKYIIILLIFLNFVFWITLKDYITWSNLNFDSLWNWLFSPSSLWINPNNDFLTNLKNIFFPSNTWRGWILRWILKIIFAWLFVIFVTRTWAMILLNSQNENELKKARMQLLYLFYWAILFFWSTLILWNWLSLENIDADRLVNNLQSNLFFNILLFLKVFAYFFAILVLIYYGIRIIRLYEYEDKIKAARSWVINVLAALVFIKAIDFLYFIVQQQDFKNQFLSFLNSIVKTWIYVIWASIVLVFFYIWANLILSRGNEEKWKLAKTMATNIFIVIFVLFIFLLLLSQFIRALWW